MFKKLFISFDLTKTSVHDIHYLEDLKMVYSNCIVIGAEDILSV